MPILICGAIWTGSVVYFLLRAMRQFRNYRSATISATSNANISSTVSIIVPVRNEIHNIGLCLTGLSTQAGLSCRGPIIVVDDGSQDGTRTAVEGHIADNPWIELIDAGPLPAGWAGKPHACWRGALASKGDWLCFIDADVRPEPELIASAVTTAEAQGVDMLSLHPRQELGSFWERVVIPAGLLVLACAKRFEPASQDVVNGQFLLVRREAYFAVGGHGAVRGEICEDTALAACIREGGFALQVLAAPHLVHTRMYRDLNSLWQGFAKNSADILGSAGKTLIAAAAVLVFAWTSLLLPLLVLPVTIAAPSAARIAGSTLAMLGTGIVVGIHLGTVRHLRVPAMFGFTFAIGYTAVASLVCHSVITRLTGRVTWKGRTYHLDKSAPRRS